MWKVIHVKRKLRNGEVSRQKEGVADVPPATPVPIHNGEISLALSYAF